MSESIPDRGHLRTEQRNTASADLDAQSVAGALRTILEQDAGVIDAVRSALPAIERAIDAVVEAMRRGGRLVYVGAGTSGRLGVLDASECPPTFQTEPGQVVGIIAGGDGALRRSSEGAEDDPNGAAAELERIGVGGEDVLVGIAAGGTTPYVLGALQIARSRRAATVLICCVAFEASDDIDHVIELPVGAEVVTGSTRMKAGTATKLVLNMISTVTMVQLGKTWGNLMVDLRATNAKLTDRAIRILCSQLEVERGAAGELLDQAKGSVKVALVMGKCGVDKPEAERLLDEHHGRLRPILGPPN